MRNAELGADLGDRDTRTEPKAGILDDAPPQRLRVAAKAAGLQLGNLLVDALATGSD
jgi:hypothetical protein